MPRFIHSSQLVEALGALDIGDTSMVQRVIIDLKMDSFPVVHVQRMGGVGLLQVIEALAGPTIQWVRDGQGEGDPQPRDTEETLADALHRMGAAMDKLRVGMQHRGVRTTGLSPDSLVEATLNRFHDLIRALPAYEGERITEIRKRLENAKLGSDGGWVDGINEALSIIDRVGPPGTTSEPEPE